MLLVEPLLDRERDPQADPPGADGPVLDHRGDAGDLGLAEAVDGGRGAVHGEADRVLDRVGGRAGERDRLLDHRSLLRRRRAPPPTVYHKAWFGQAMQAMVPRYGVVALFAPVKVVGGTHGGVTGRRCARFLAPAE